MDNWKTRKENVISMVISMELHPGNEKLSKSASPLGKGKSKRGTRKKYKIISDMEDMGKKENFLTGALRVISEI